MIPIETRVPAYRFPWEKPLAERIQMLRRHPLKVMYYSEKYNDTTFRYRVYNMCEAINLAHDGVSASWFSEADGSRLLELVDECAVLVVHRALYRDFFDRLVSRAKTKGIPVIYDIDDYVVDPSTAPLIIRTQDQHKTTWGASEWAFDFTFGQLARFRFAAELCDSLLVTNKFLADKVSASLKKPAAVIPNFLGPDQLELSNQLAAARLAGKRVPGDILLGYFSGSATHRFDFQVAAGAIAKVMREYPNVRLRIVGYLDAKTLGLDEFGDRVEILPFTNYLNLQCLIAEVDINLSPLLENDFTNCKSELKYFDAGILGVPTLASPIYTMKTAIDSGEYGYLVNNIDWYESLKSAVAEFPDRLEEMGAKAREQVLATYTPEAQGPVICHLLKSLV